MVSTLLDFNSTQYYIFSHLELIHEELEIIIKQEITFIDQCPELQNEAKKGKEINKEQEELKVPSAEDTEIKSTTNPSLGNIYIYIYRKR